MSIPSNSVRTPTSKRRILSVFSLVMINVIAVDSIRNLPMAASYGFGLVFLYLMGTLFYFIPTALMTAELSTTWPEKGGLYSWAKHAFSPRIGFLVVYIQWIYNIVWYPTILTLIAGTCAYLVDPDLASNPVFMLTTVLTTFWGCTLLNCFGMRLSSWVSTFGSLVGTLLPMMLISFLAFKWLIAGNESQTVLSFSNFIPKIDSIQEMVFFTGILFSLLGLEMSSVHALEVKNPSKDYPKALLISVVLVAVSLTLASLAIAIIVPKAELDVVTGIIQAFVYFFDSLNLSGLAPWVAGIIVIGGVCAVATWIIGPTKGLFAAADDDLIPAALGKLNRFGAPLPMLLLQGAICTVLSLVYLLLPSVQSAYWLLSAMAAQLAFLMYAILFVSAVRLRYVKPDVIRPFKIPFGNVGIWVVCSVGFLVSIMVIVLGFVPPTSIDVGNIWRYEGLLIGADLLVLAPLLFLGKKSLR